jgi:hypothetical protein
VIFFLDRFRLKLPGEKIERRLGLGAEQQTARVGVEPVHVRHAMTITQMRVHEAHEIFPRLVPAIRRHQQAARLVERDEHLVFKNGGR